ncbi:MAG: Smr/MutS family protein [bacterium]
MISPDAEIDLHERKPHEIRMELLSFLDKGYAEDWDKVHVIHGKGKGTMREVVWEILEGLSYVEEFELGSYYEGGRGMTVVYYRKNENGRAIRHE